MQIGQPRHHAREGIAHFGQLVLQGLQRLVVAHALGRKLQLIGKIREGIRPDAQHIGGINDAGFHVADGAANRIGNVGIGFPIRGAARLRQAPEARFLNPLEALDKRIHAVHGDAQAAIQKLRLGLEEAENSAQSGNRQGDSAKRRCEAGKPARDPAKG